MLAAWKARARQLKTEVYALYLAYRDPRLPWYARLVAAAVAAYAFSPIDLIPDFIPLLGYLDDLLIVPLGVALAIKLIPPAVMAEARQRAQAELASGKPVNWVAAVLIITLWLLALSGLVWLIFHLIIPIPQLSIY
jgi:uncharacterized membrane protein YkvA (DUF1232 family)